MSTLVTVVSIEKMDFICLAEYHAIGAGIQTSAGCDNQKPTYLESYDDDRY
jgi:hypothetical protein